ncbi:hypothetical protein MMC28_007371 [Mycoblastus sanguinarius]|nr:hypothetical protein [Mycoblastus sanguinarius]
MSCEIITVPPPCTTNIAVSDIYTIDGVAKRSLFQDVEPVSQQESIRARDVLSRLQVLSPNLAKDFKLREDSMDDIPFRLLSHREDPSTPEVSYIALSYCWADDTARTNATGSAFQGIIVPENDKDRTDSTYPLPSSPLLFQALLNERSCSREGIWIDAVCINQQNVAEKYKAINAMNLVYQSARETVFLLDDVDVTKSEYDFLQAYLPLYKSSIAKPLIERYAPESMASNKIYRDFFVKIMQARWFSRAWCNHEMSLSRSLVFLIRCDFISAQPSVVRFTGEFLLFFLTQGLRSGLGTLLPENMLHIFRVLLPSVTVAKRAHQLVHSHMETFAEVFSLTAGGDRALAEENRLLDGNLDKLHIAINTTGIGLSYIRASSVKDEVILPSKEECCRKFTILALAARDPIALCISGPLMHLGGRMRSWLNWPMPRDIQHGSEPPEMLSDIAVRAMTLDRSSAAEYISLDLMVLDARRDASEPSDTFIERAKDIIDACKREGLEIRSLRLEYMNSGIEFSALNCTKPIDRATAATRLHTRCLACVLECGPHWAAWVAKKLPEPSHDPEMIIISIEALIHGTFQSFIKNTKNRNAVEAVLHLVGYIIRRAVPWETTEHSWMMWQPRLVSSIGGGGKLLIFDRLEENIMIAVPTCLVHEQYWHFFRGWTVVPVSRRQLMASSATAESLGGDMGAAFCLVAKTRVFGRIELEDERLKFGVLSKGVRVYGIPCLGP